MFELRIYFPGAGVAGFEGGFIDLLSVVLESELPPSPPEKMETESKKNY